MRRIALALALALLLGCPAPGAAETGYVTASALVVRTGPGLDFAMITEIPNGAELELISYTNGWYFVQYGDSLGYVHGRYVRVALPGGAAAPQPTIESTPLPLPAGTMPPGLTLPQLEFTGENNPAYPSVMKPGDMGNSVIDLQVTLQTLGYTVDTDGKFGYDTQAAVMKQQLKLGIDADGIVGMHTRRMIGNENYGGVELLDWWKGGNVAYPRLTEATVLDVRTGRRFTVFRYGGDNHCDVEPLTSQDTATLRAIAGGEWTWERRPVWLEVNGRIIAASIHCYPHAGEHILDNGFDGHVCMHFLSSRTHDTNRVDEDHAACVQEAWNNRSRYSAAQ